MIHRCGESAGCVRKEVTKGVPSCYQRRSHRILNIQAWPNHAQVHLWEVEASIYRHPAWCGLKVNKSERLLHMFVSVVYGDDEAGEVDIGLLEEIIMS